jgi:gluconate 2-dehydrogenase alpha chain
MPNGVGGAGLHWNAETWRFLPSDFVLKTHLTQRYGTKFLPPDMTIQDWGVTYDELEPHFDTFEYLCGTSGTAGNLKGQKQPFGNPWEGPRSRPYPTPAQKQPYGPVLWAEAAKEMGYSPFPQPSGNLSQAYTNPLGVTLGPCTYCGFCERFGCGNYSKASPQITLLPVLMRRSNFEARTEWEVTHINLDNTGKRATGVTYVDTQGREWEQPAEMVFLCAFQMFNVQLLLLSGIGQAYEKHRSGRNRPEFLLPGDVQRASVF